MPGRLEFQVGLGKLRVRRQRLVSVKDCKIPSCFACTAELTLLVCGQANSPGKNTSGVLAETLQTQT
jgi:hypothetical protein